MPMQWRDDTTPQLALGGSPLESDAKVRGKSAYFGCSPCAASGHTAAPPSSVTKSRRLMHSPQAKEYIVPRRLSWALLCITAELPHVSFHPQGRTPSCIRLCQRGAITGSEQISGISIKGERLL